jgi:hypothetical protein
MDFTVDDIQPVTVCARKVVLDFNRAVADFGDDRAALLRFGIDPGRDGETFAIIRGVRFV